MTNQEYHALLTLITARKTDIEAKDADLEMQISECLVKRGTVQTKQRKRKWIAGRIGGLMA